MAGGFKLGDFQGPNEPKTSYGSMISTLISVQVMGSICFLAVMRTTGTATSVYKRLSLNSARTELLTTIRRLNQPATISNSVSVNANTPK